MMTENEIKGIIDALDTKLKKQKSIFLLSVP